MTDSTATSERLRYLLSTRTEDLVAIWRPAGQLQSAYESPLVRRLYDDAAARAGYRNFLDVGTLKVEAVELAQAALRMR